MVQWAWEWPGICSKPGCVFKGFDISETALTLLNESGGTACNSVARTCEDVDALIIMVVNGSQARTVLFEQHGANSLAQGSVVLLCTTMSPADTRAIGNQLQQQGLLVIDAPVSGGQTGADAGTLSIMASGPDAAFVSAAPVLDAISKKVYRLGDAPGVGSTYKTVHQLGAGVHLAAMGELMAFGVRAGCDPHTLYDIVSNSAAQSWMFDDRVPYLLNNDYKPRSAVDIFVKDMNLVLETGEQVRMSLPLASAAQALFVAASNAGYGGLNDAAVVKVFEDSTGVDVAKGVTGLEDARD